MKVIQYQPNKKGKKERKKKKYTFKDCNSHYSRSRTLQQTQGGWHDLRMAKMQGAPVHFEFLRLLSDASYQNTGQANTEASHH